MIIWRWIKGWKLIAKDSFSMMGLLWFFTEVLSYFFPTFHEKFDLTFSFYIFLLLGILYGIVKNYPKSSCCRKIRDRDSRIELRIGNAFKNNGALVIPFNDYYDVSLNGNVRKAKSLQNELIKRFFFEKDDELKDEIGSKIDLSEVPFSIGKVIEIEIRQRKWFYREDNKRFYLLVSSKKNQNSRVSSTLDDFMEAVTSLWDYLATDASRDEFITVPLIGTQHGRNPDLTRKVVIQQIIDTFIEASKRRSVCDRLIISINPSDIEKGEIDFEKLSEYLTFQCENYKDTKFDPKPEGREIEPSIISDIR
ncbi:MAG: sugar porter family MFS transporter [Candidatus Moranbacteria bacterium]|nr:sugar porter family MFS transporter [Candidatus Moranbacteria bacterium]